METAPSTLQILRRHFLRRLLDNDLISPETDRHEVLVLLAVALAVPGLMITVVLLGQKYVIGIPTPGLTAMAALDDKFLYITASMLVMALIATLLWDSLALDARDTANLGPLPVAPRLIGHAQLSAMAIFVVGFAVALNAVPSLVFPLLTVSHFHVDIVAVARMIVVHAVVTMAAGAYAFFTVLLIRESLRLVLTARGFERVSAAVQGFLVVSLGSALLLLPWLSSHVDRQWFDASARATTIPPVWFLGLYESGTHSITLQVRGLGLRIPAGLVEAEQQARVTYDALAPQFRTLGITATLVLLATCGMALGLYVWNNRRLPPLPLTPHGGTNTIRLIAARLVGRVIVPHPLARAGFFFTIQALARSTPHRMSLAAAAAIASAGGIVTLHGLPLHLVADASAIPIKLLALQPVVITVVLAGARNAMRLPAELRANWVFQLAWRGDVRPFLTGVKRAVLATVGMSTLLILFIPSLLILGPLRAGEHLAGGYLIAAIVLELLLSNASRLPFICGATPLGSLKGAAPLYLMLVIAVAINFAHVERLALGDPQRMAVLLGVLGALYAVIRMCGWHRQRPHQGWFEFDDLPDLPTQRLGLSETV